MQMQANIYDYMQMVTFLLNVLKIGLYNNFLQESRKI